MEILGIGPSELIFIIIIALILLGPKDMQKAGLTIGKWLRKFITSDGWKLFQQTSREIQTLPNRLMREAELDELNKVQDTIHKDLKQTVDAVQESGRPSLPASPSAPQPAPPKTMNPTPPTESENIILPTPPSSDRDEEKNA